MGTEIEKMTSFSRTQISPVFVKDITQAEPTYVLVDGINTAPFVIEAPFFYGKVTGEEIEIEPNGEYSTEYQGVAYITPLVNAKINISMQAGEQTTLNLQNFFGSVKIGTPKGITGNLQISNPNNVTVRVYLIIWELPT